jgi:hypothetical protein
MEVCVKSNADYADNGFARTHHVHGDMKVLNQVRILLGVIHTNLQRQHNCHHVTD